MAHLSRFLSKHFSSPPLSFSLSLYCSIELTCQCIMIAFLFYQISDEYFWLCSSGISYLAHKQRKAVHQGSVPRTQCFFVFFYKQKWKKEGKLSLLTCQDLCCYLKFIIRPFPWLYQHIKVTFARCFCKILVSPGKRAEAENNSYCGYTLS